MKTILIAFLAFLFHQVFGKIVTDSLPNLSLPNIIKFIKKSFVNIRFYLAMLTLILLVRFKKMTDYEEKALIVFAVVALIIFYAQSQYKNNKQILAHG